MLRIGTRAPAFILAELICVVIILTIAGLLIFPLFARTADKARNTPCLANLHEIGTALRLYMHDYDFTFPTLNDEAAAAAGDEWGEGFDGHWTNWDAKRRNYHRTASIATLLDRYACEWNAWACPSDPGADRRWGLGRRWSSYHYRHYLAAGLAPGYRDAPLLRRTFREQDFDRPSNTFVFNEIWPWHDDRRSDLKWLPARAKQGWDPQAKVRLAFMDGHIRVMPADQCLLRSPDWRGQGYDYHWPKGTGLTDCD